MFRENSYKSTSNSSTHNQKGLLDLCQAAAEGDSERGSTESDADDVDAFEERSEMCENLDGMEIFSSSTNENSSSNPKYIDSSRVTIKGMNDTFEKAFEDSERKKSKPSREKSKNYLNHWEQQVIVK